MLPSFMEILRHDTGCNNWITVSLIKQISLKQLFASRQIIVNLLKFS